MSEQLSDEEFEYKRAGWAVRAPHGEQYGVTYISEYKDDVKELFERAVSESTNKMNSAMMREELQRKCPGRFSIPGENEIRAEMSRLFFSLQKRTREAEDEV